MSTVHEGTYKVNKLRLNLQRTNYKAFKIGTNETITEMFTRLMDNVNTMKSLGETFSDEMVIEKILRILPASWNAPVAAIQESKDLKDYELKEFLGSIMMYEATMLKKSEIKDKTVAFKATNSSKKKAKEIITDSDSETSSSSSSNCSEGEMAHFVKKFHRMNFRKFNKKKSWKPETSSKEPRCFHCNKKGNINPD